MNTNRVIQLRNPDTGDIALYDGTSGRIIVEGRGDMDVEYTLAALGRQPDSIIVQDCDRVAFSLVGFTSFPKVLEGFEQAVEVSQPLNFVDSIVAQTRPAAPQTDEEIEVALLKANFRRPGFDKARRVLGRVAPELVDQIPVDADIVKTVATAGEVELPIGERLPRVGEKVYVDGFVSTFRAVEGGLGTVKLLVTQQEDGSFAPLEDETPQREQANYGSFEDDDDEDDDWFEDEDEDDEDDHVGGNSLDGYLSATTAKDVFIVLEELPLDMFNWKDIRHRQGELAIAYGTAAPYVVVDNNNPETLVDSDEEFAAAAKPTGE